MLSCVVYILIIKEINNLIKMDYSNFLVHNCPPTAMYIPNFLTSEEENRILKEIEKTPKPKWNQLLNRRLINFGGLPHPKGMISEELPTWLQTYVDKINNLGIFGSLKANHVLVNEYLSGQGIMPHTDGPLFHPIISTISLGSHAVLEFYKRNHTNDCDDNIDLSTSNAEDPNHKIASTENMTPNGTQICSKLLIEPRSLLILKDSLYTDYLHSISEIHEDILCDLISNLGCCENQYKLGDRIQRKTRISLTIRHVPKTTKLKLKF